MSEPIRVLQVIGSMNHGGAESMIMNLYREIDRSKVQFDFLVCTKEKGAFDDEIISLGGSIYHDVERITKDNLLKYQKLCDDFFKAHRYGLVHCHIGSIAQFVTRAAKRCGAYTIVHCHSATNNKQYRFLAFPARFTADFYMSCGKKAGEIRFGSRIVNSDRFMILNNAIQTEKYRFNKELQDNLRQQYGIENKFVIGHIGRMVYAKNHDFLLDIFNEILKIKPDSVLVLAGDGVKKEPIEEKAKLLGLTDKIIFLGTVENVNEILNMFDIMIFPSHYEGLPISLIEAQANGLQCLVSDGVSAEAGICECLEFMSLEKSAEEWAEKALNKGDYIHRDYSADIIKAGYDVKATAKMIENFYKEHYKN